MMDKANGTGGTKRIVKRLLILTLAMFGFGYALVPLYAVFCEVTGINGRAIGITEVSAQTQVDEQRWITVEFMANVNDALPWDFKPTQFEMKVHPGELTTAIYIARNRADYAVTGQAVPSVAPGIASRFFDKTECFCFTEQRLEPGEEREMAVQFIIDPDMPDSVPRLTLAYTFYNADAPAKGAQTHEHQGHADLVSGL